MTGTVLSGTDEKAIIALYTTVHVLCVYYMYYMCFIPYLHYIIFCILHDCVPYINVLLIQLHGCQNVINVI